MARKLHGTLTAATVATVTVDGPFGSLVVVNHGSDAIYLTHGKVAGDVVAPTVAGNDTDVVPAGGAWAADPIVNHDQTHTVKLISSGAPAYSVLGGETL